MRGLAAVFVICCGFAQPDSSLGQCGFAIVPASEQRWIRAEGWPIPGLSDAKGFAKMHRSIDGKPKDFVLPEGVAVSWVVHDDDYTVQFPDVVFDDNGSQKRMLPRSFKLYRMLRWEMNGKPFAYSYELGPYDVACLASVDIVDDRGDGKYRVMTSPGHTLFGQPGSDPEPPPLPRWLSSPKS